MGRSPFYGGQFRLSAQLIKPNYLVILPPTQSKISFKALKPSPVFLKIIFELIGFLDVGVILTLQEYLKLIEPCRNWALG